MDFHTFGDKQNPSIMLIHGGGNAWWNFLRQARVLAKKYYVILPTLDGHGSERETPYQSTEATADKLLAYIDQNCGGHLFALGGVSLGGQIVAELLSRRPKLTQKAIIDGSLLYPQPAMARFCILTVKCLGKMLFSEKACRKQLEAMNKMLPEKMLYPQEIQDYYMQDMPYVPRETPITIYRTYMMKYQLRESLKDTQAQVMCWYGEKEMKCVKKSAQLFKGLVQNCQIYEAKDYNHGYLALYLPDEWLALAMTFFEQGN
ncbi:MAG: alpha/beta fold hydrolase [Cellulosilyticaceae bacterium]